jgi:hypothetical protein
VLHLTLAACLLVLDLDDLSVVLQDVGEAVPGEDAPPEEVGFQPKRIGRVARAVVPTLVERKEPATCAGQVLKRFQE